MKLIAICRGVAEKMPGKSYRTGIGKHAISGPVLLDAHGLLGDAVCNTKHHGGPDQAILLEGSLTLDWWAQQLGKPVPCGLFGENLVVGGLDNRDVAVGDRFRIGEAVLEAASARIPCNTLSAKMGDPGFARLYREARRPGIYCRVLSAGVLEAGMPVDFMPRDGERIAIAALPQLMKAGLDVETKRRLLAAPVGIRVREWFENRR